ncbi:MAG TPA: response regulator transcription factor [Candidatus Acidoferrales bacterium]|nr:response regulator transcription factor [Candidatus Acidoferrales bacterium]
MHRILLIDHGSLGASLASMLELENLGVLIEANPVEGLRSALQNKPELVLINLPMLGMTCAEFSAGLRECLTRLPLVVLGDGDEAERVRLFEAGADDYVVKPFSLRELLARVRAILRRTAGAPTGVIRFGRIEADLERGRVIRDGAEVGFTPVEYRLLVFFLRSGGRVVPREEVVRSVLGYAGRFQAGKADVHVMRLRQKLECNPASPRHLQSVQGVGYRFLM